MHGVIMAGTHSGCGKTTITLGLLAALRKKGLVVQPFKAGPDFIDTGLHGLVTGRRSRNLDLWMCGEEYVRACVRAHADNADIAVVEGVMGMYDGEFSTARLAEVLGLPVILIIDAYGMAESAGAVVKGFLEFGVMSSELRETNSRFKIQNSGLLACLPAGRARDSKLSFAGVIFNRVGSARHYTRLKESIRDVPVLGYLPRDLDFTIPHRHLGLHVAEEGPISRDEIARLAEAVLAFIDVEQIIQNSRFKTQNSRLKIQDSRLKTQDSKFTKGDSKALTHDLPTGEAGSKPRIAIACDKAFCFYYKDNLEMLRDAGAEIIEFSPLADSELPEGIDVLYLGGGYPELYAKDLSVNRTMRESIRNFSAGGHPVYAECGGFMYLTRGIYDFEENFYPMAGVFPFRTAMKKGRANLGYREIELQDNCLLGHRGDVLRGHEFHYSEVFSAEERKNGTPKGETSALPRCRASELTRSYSVKDAEGHYAGQEGYMIRNTLGSYIHLHFGSNKETVKNLVHFIKERYGMYSACRTRQSQKGRQQP